MVKIYTLGYFDINIGEESVLNRKGNPYQLIKLLKYFITYNGRTLLPENIIEDLWPDNEFQNPRNVLRTHISRLRKMIKSWEDFHKEFYEIEYVNGYYKFETKDNVEIDFEIFTGLIEEGNFLKDANPDKALDILKEGLAYYKAEYLSEVEYEDWIIPIRNRYHRMYLKGMMNYLEILKSKDMNNEIVKICEEAIIHEPHDEMLHIYFIEALLEIGQKRYALSHYEYFTSKVYSQFRTSPSDKMKALYKKIQSYDDNTKDNIEWIVIDKELMEDLDENGALICDPFYFKFLYNLERRKRPDDSKRNVFLGLLSIENSELKPLPESDKKEALNTLVSIVYKNLRKGDILSKISDSQLVLLLYSVESDSLETIIKRLRIKFQEKCKMKNIVLSIKYKPL